MDGTITATDARIHFGELMRRVVEQKEPVVVERSGRPQVVVLAIEDYEALLAAKEDRNGWRDLLRRSHDQPEDEPEASAWAQPQNVIQLQTQATGQELQLGGDLSPEDRLRLIHDLLHSGQIPESAELPAEQEPEPARPVVLPESEETPYQGEFVAVVDGWIVDHDPDPRTLFLHIRRRYGEGIALIVPAEWAEPPICRIQSVRNEEAAFGLV